MERRILRYLVVSNFIHGSNGSEMTFSYQGMRENNSGREVAMLSNAQAAQWAEKRRIFDTLKDYLLKRVQISPGWRVAEFGVGKWGFARFYLEITQSAVGIDIEDYSSFHPGVDFVLSDGVTVPLPDDTIDLTVSHSVLEHVGDLDQSLSEINRITRPGGYLFLTVAPLYYAAYGAHLREGGKQLDNWEHLDQSGRYYLVTNPIPGAKTIGHALNRLTSSKFLAAVGRQPWAIVAYDLSFENKPPPSSIDRSQCAPLDLIVRGFRFIGRKQR